MNRSLVFNSVAVAILAWSFTSTSAFCQTSLPAPTPGEARVRKALAEATTFDFKGQSLLDVVGHLRQTNDLQVLLDNKALVEAGIGADIDVPVSARDVSLRSALRLMLGQLDLTYIVRDGYLLITSRTEAENMIAARIYPVGDLVTVDGQPAAPQESNYSTLIEVITSTVQPTTWDEVGGPSPLYVFYPGRALIISQTEEVHEDIETLLSALRDVRDAQFKLAEHPRTPESEKEDDSTVSTKIYRLWPLSMWAPSRADMNGVGLTEHAPVLAQMGMGGMGMGGMGMGGLGMGGGASGPVDAKQLAAWGTELAEMLPQFIEPTSWDSHGGHGTVRAFAGALIVKQTGAVHREVAKLLSQLLPGTHLMSQTTRLAPVAPRGPLPDWPRKPFPLPNDREKAIERALATKVNADFEDMPLDEAIGQLGQMHKVQMVFDQKALLDARIGCDTSITYELSDATLSEALSNNLGDLDLTFVIEHEALVITSKIEAENLLTTKVYPVLDLVASSRDLSRFATYPSLAQMVMFAVEPHTSDNSGGPGCVQGYPNCGALIVSQTTAVHEKVQRFLDSLRESRNQAEVAK